MVTTSPSSSNHARRTWPPVLALCALSLLLYVPVVFHPFSNWDDSANVYRNPSHQTPQWHALARLWTHPYFASYLPVTRTVWFALAALSHGDTVAADGTSLRSWPFHALNVALHTLNACLVLLLLGRIVGRGWPAWIGAALFAVHPLQVEPVAWVTGLKDLLAATLSLLCLLQYLRYAQTDPGHMGAARRHYATATVLFVLALLAKASAVALPLAAFALGHWVARRPARWCVATLGGWLLPAALLTVVNRFAEGDKVVEQVGWWLRPFVAGEALTFYLGKLAWPAKLCLDYGHRPDVVLATWPGYVTGFIGLAALIALWWAGRRRPLCGVAGAFFLAGVLPTLGLTPFAYQVYSTVADRYLYFALIGVALAAALLLRSFTRPSRRLFVIAAVTAGLTLCAVQTVIQATYWGNDVALFAHTLSVNPHSFMAHEHLATVYAQAGRVAEAVSEHEQALQLNPNWGPSHTQLAVLLQGQGELGEAVRHAREGVRLNPGTAASHLALGAVLCVTGDFNEAEAAYARGLQLDPYAWVGYCGLAHLRRREGRLDEALAAYEQALALNPHYVLARNNLGVTLALAGRYAEAVPQLQEALRLQPDNWETHLALGTVLRRLGRQAEGTAQLQEAIRLNPQSPALRRAVQQARER